MGDGKIQTEEYDCTPSWAKPEERSLPIVTMMKKLGMDSKD
jgi:hypothetical protein